MLNYSRLNKVIAVSLLVPLITACLITKPAISKSDEDSCKSNNGHGNNKVIDLSEEDALRRFIVVAKAKNLISQNHKDNADEIFLCAYIVNKDNRNKKKKLADFGFLNSNGIKYKRVLHSTPHVANALVQYNHFKT